MKNRRAAAKYITLPVAFRFTATNSKKLKCLPQAQHRHFRLFCDPLVRQSKPGVPYIVTCQRVCWQEVSRLGNTGLRRLSTPALKLRRAGREDRNSWRLSSQKSQCGAPRAFFMQPIRGCTLRATKTVVLSGLPWSSLAFLGLPWSSVPIPNLLRDCRTEISVEKHLELDPESIPSVCNAKITWFADICPPSPMGTEENQHPVVTDMLELYFDICVNLVKNSGV